MEVVLFQACEKDRYSKMCFDLPEYKKKLGDINKKIYMIN